MQPVEEMDSLKSYIPMVLKSYSSLSHLRSHLRSSKGFVLQTISFPLGITWKFRNRACWGGELVRVTLPDGSTGLFLLILCQMNTSGFLIRKGDTNIYSYTSCCLQTHLNTRSSDHTFSLTTPSLHVLSTPWPLPREHQHFPGKGHPQNGWPLFKCLCSSKD